MNIAITHISFYKGKIKMNTFLHNTKIIQP